MKIAAIIVRILMGALFVFGAVMYFVHPAMPPMSAGPLKTYMDGLIASGYFLTLLKATELVCGLALVSGFFVPLALVVISPVIVNIFCVHLFLEPSGLPVAIPLVLGNLFLGYAYREKFAPMLKAK
ncbi:MAG: hypothetical protein QM796_20170 [Chthoniobacteraceae bacterium]